MTSSASGTKAPGFTATYNIKVWLVGPASPSPSPTPTGTATPAPSPTTTGPVTAGPVKVTLTPVPSKLRPHFTSATCPSGTGATCTFKTLTAGKTRSLTATMLVPKSEPDGTVKLTAKATAPNQPGVTASAPVTRTVTVQANGSQPSKVPNKPPSGGGGGTGGGGGGTGGGGGGTNGTSGHSQHHQGGTTGNQQGTTTNLTPSGVGATLPFGMETGSPAGGLSPAGLGSLPGPSSSPGVVFPKVTPSPTQALNPLGLPSPPRRLHLTDASGFPLDQRLIGVEAFGLAVLVAAVLIAAVRFSRWRRRRPRHRGTGTESAPARPDRPLEHPS